MNFRDIETLSSYLDGRLSPSEAARLEKRLASDAGLRAALQDLRETRAVLRRLPQRRAPRSFRLTPKMAGIRPPEPRAYPAFRLATALATFLFLAAVAVNAVTPFAAGRLTAAPAPAYGFGGGGGGAPDTFATSAPPMAAAPAATEAPPAQPLAAPTGTAEATMLAQAAPTLAPTPDDLARATGGGPATESSNKTGLAQPQARTVAAPIPVGWVEGLGVVMVLLAAGGWWLRRSSERRVRSQWNRK
jgi:hypothetical protein